MRRRFCGTAASAATSTSCCAPSLYACLRRATTAAAAAVPPAQLGGLDRPLLAPHPAAQLLRDAIERRGDAASLRWVDIANALPAALATRESDTLLCCVLHKMSAADKSSDDRLTLDVACGLLQASQYADIESRASELYERAAVVDSLVHRNDGASPSPSHDSEAVRAQARGLALFLSNGAVPLSLRQRCADGTATVQLLRRLLTDGGVAGTASDQAILIDAAGKVLERLACSSAAMLNPDAVSGFLHCVSACIRRWFVHAEAEAARLNDDAQLRRSAPSSFDAVDPSESGATATVMGDAPAADPLKILCAERAMMREAWRRLQRVVRRSGDNAAALVETVHSELQYHLKLVAVGTAAASASKEKNGAVVATLSGQELTDAELDELSLFDFQCAVDAMHTTSNLLLSRLLGTHPIKQQSPMQTQQQEQALSLPQLLQTVRVADQLRGICPLDSDEWLALRDAVTVAGLIARHSIEALHGRDAGLRVVFRSLLAEQMDEVLRIRSSSSSSKQAGASDSGEIIEGADDDAGAAKQSKESILAKQLEEDLLQDGDSDAASSSANAAVATTTSAADEGLDELAQQQLRASAGADLAVVNKHGDLIVHRSMRAVLLIAALHHFSALESSSASSSRASAARTEQDVHRGERLLQCIVRHHFPRGTNVQQLRHGESGSYAAASNAALSAVAAAAASASADASEFDAEGNAFSDSASSLAGSSAVSSAFAVPPPDYELLQHAHVAVIRALCSIGQGEEPSNATAAAAAVDEAYSLLSAHKYYGVRVTSKMMLPLLRRLSPRGDSRVFNAIDLCALFSGCTVTHEALAEALKACAAAGDHHRARVLMQLVRADVPGILMKLPEDALTALGQLDVLPKVAPTFFDKIELLEEGKSEPDCLPLVVASAGATAAPAVSQK